MAEITIFDNGPLKVTGGGVVLKDMTGKPFNPPNKEQFALCRCGHSANKPFCDGSHKTSGFQSQCRAP
jgi:CDGSH-type Zn-finger protein